MKNSTNLRTPYDPRNTDAILDFFNTPEHHTRVKKARQKQAFHYWKIRLTLDAALIALGFILGVLLV